MLRLKRVGESSGAQPPLFTPSGDLLVCHYGTRVDDANLFSPSSNNHHGAGYYLYILGEDEAHSPIEPRHYSKDRHLYTISRGRFLRDNLIQSYEYVKSLGFYPTSGSTHSFFRGESIFWNLYAYYYSGGSDSRYDPRDAYSFYADLSRKLRDVAKIDGIYFVQNGRGCITLFNLSLLTYVCSERKVGDD